MSTVSRTEYVYDEPALLLEQLEWTLSIILGFTKGKHAAALLYPTPPAPHPVASVAARNLFLRRGTPIEVAVWDNCDADDVLVESMLVEMHRVPETGLIVARNLLRAFGREQAPGTGIALNRLVKSPRVVLFVEDEASWEPFARRHTGREIHSILIRNQRPKET